MALNDTMEAWARLGGEIMVLTFSAPKVMVMALTMLTRTPDVAAPLIRLMLASLRPRNQAGRVKEVYRSGYLACSRTSTRLRLAVASVLFS